MRVQAQHTVFIISHLCHTKSKNARDFFSFFSFLVHMLVKPPLKQACRSAPFALGEDK